MTPSQSWLFILLSFYSIAITVYAFHWRNRYYDAQSYRIYASKQEGYKRTQLDDIYAKSFFKD